MILVYLKGGLGNQMFQYAAARALAEHHSVPLKLDKTYYDKKEYAGDSLNDYFDISSYRDILNVFTTTAQTASADEADSYRPSLLIKITDRLKRYYKRRIYRQPFLGFDVNFFKTKKNVLLKGNFQSEKYFGEYTDVIREEFSFKESVIKKNELKAAFINSVKSVSLHIRRGDYSGNTVANKVLGALEIEYYHKAIAQIENKIGGDTYCFIFSDDTEWVKENFNSDKKIIYAEEGMNDIDEFYLMSCCRHNIIANSSYSWWAAWLNINKEKIVIAPAKWFNDESYSSRDLIPDHWIKL